MINWEIYLVNNLPTLLSLQIFPILGNYKWGVRGGWNPSKLLPSFLKKLSNKVIELLSLPLLYFPSFFKLPNRPLGLGLSFHPWIDDPKGNHKEVIGKDPTLQPNNRRKIHNPWDLPYGPLFLKITFIPAKFRNKQVQIWYSWDDLDPYWSYQEIFSSILTQSLSIKLLSWKN